MSIKTIVDKDGNVWTGKEASKSVASDVADVALTAMTGGLSLFFKEDSTCVTVNGEKHYGKEVKGNK